MILDCTCFRVRRLSRQISQLYDEALRPVGLRVTQYSLMSALRNEGPMKVSALAEGLGADSTSMSRALAALEAQGWVVVGPGADKRSKSVDLSASGRQKLVEAEPFWATAQQRIADSLGSDGQDELDRRLDALFRRLSTS